MLSPIDFADRPEMAAAESPHSRRWRAFAAHPAAIVLKVGVIGVWLAAICILPQLA